MDVDTGAILGMATKGDFDPNDPFTITDEQKAQELAAITDEEEYSEKRNEILQAQWRNKAVTDTYDPGSTFKILTASMALEEKAITVDSTFYCPGYRMVEGWPQPIKCWYYPRAHGSQNLYQAIQNSCNPAFIDIGQAVGAKTFLEYYKAFGLDEPTGIDLPGEGESIFHSEEQFLSNKVDLATASFGQNFQISPLQLITAVSAVANGGNLMKPYIVKEILDSDELFEMGFKAVFVGSGAGLPMFMHIPGEALKGVCSANEYLTRINLMKAYKEEYDTPILHSKAAAIVGGGNVAMDAARCAKRMGTDKVYIVDRRGEAEMPARLGRAGAGVTVGMNPFNLSNT